MRLCFGLILLVLVTGCRAPYSSEYADMAISHDELPPIGTTSEALATWFNQQGYVPGTTVVQATAELTRRPGEPLVYALPADKQRWLTQHRTVRHVCFTTKTVYYRVDAQGALLQAIPTKRSQC